ncbi:MAG: DUF1295 domain-containing protein [Okeania sp. SIO2G5]|nr:DUF1295 domain-containing protein [Okeania sp. SIO2G5]NEP76642.1 DUF1295 domain-containing protein [Okeania sp. SIO2G5]
MKLKHPINVHKGLTAPVVLAMMVVYDNFGVGPWIYLALHGTYGLLWLFKDQVFPDAKWEEECSLGIGGVTFLALGLYWVAPWLLISGGAEPPFALVAGAIALNLMGTVLHYGGDAQKYFMLQERKGLITTGFFSRCRNPNYLGEVLIYASFTLLSMHWIPAVILGAFFAGVFVPNMYKKDESLARYPEFEAYKQQSGLLLPKI